MEKQLSEMTLEELWALFPIYLVKYNPSWKQWYEEEKINLYKILQSQKFISINHIGSTSIGTIWAKPIIDIMIEVYNDCDLETFKTILEDNGYICMAYDKKRITFNKGYTSKGFEQKVFHLHIRCDGDNDELYFRDYLIEHYDIAKEYEKLKLSLWKEYEYNRDMYTEAKGDFIKKYTSIAKQLYSNRYY